MIRNPYYINPFWFIIIFLFSCDNNTTKPNEQKSSTQHITSTKPTDSGEISNTLTDTLTEEKNKDYPLLVIENCAALWPIACTPETFQNKEQILKKASAFLNNDSLISLGSNGVLNQEILNSFCMKGECGGNQVALELLRKECFGILASKKIISNIIIFKV